MIDPASLSDDDDDYRTPQPTRTQRWEPPGAPARPGRPPSKDENIKALLGAETPVVTIVAKTWESHVVDSLRISAEENLELISKSVAYLAKRTDEVILDAEHFFDGFAENPEYAMQCLQAAADAGAAVLCLCDTRGGTLPDGVTAAVEATASLGPVLGIH